mgnify:CR=1 FL=1
MSVDQVGADVGTIRIPTGFASVSVVSVDQVGADVGTLEVLPHENLLHVSVDQVGADVGTASSEGVWP